MAKNMMWGDAENERLKELWEAGMSASQIARALTFELKRTVTRNACIGRVHRMGLAGRVTPGKAPRPRLPAAPRMYQDAKPLPEPAPEAQDPVRLDSGALVTVLTINDRMCRWPIGDPQEETFHFCGRAPERGVYCAFHASKAYAPQQVRNAEKTERAVSAYKDALRAIGE